MGGWGLRRSASVCGLAWGGGEGAVCVGEVGVMGVGRNVETNGGGRRKRWRVIKRWAGEWGDVEWGAKGRV